MKTKHTARKFNLIEFDDLYGQHCSIQKSSLATDNAIWFGVDNTGEEMGNKDVNERMHLNQKQAKALLSILEEFVKNGELPKTYRAINS